MKEISELVVPEGLRYSNDHEWVRAEEDNVRIGITDYAQEQLGEIVFAELPEVGDTFSKGDEFGSLESVKAVAEVFMPVTGKITAINEDLEDNPDLVNKEPYEGGWLIEVRIKDTDEFNALMDKDEYLEMLKGL